MDTKLVIDVTRLDPSGEELVGEVDCVDLDEPFVKPFGGIRYRLTAQVFGTELLVRGHLEQDFDLVCSRCGKAAAWRHTRWITGSCGRSCCTQPQRPAASTALRRRQPFPCSTACWNAGILP